MSCYFVTDITSLCAQWNRLRGSLCGLLKSLLLSTNSKAVYEMLHALVQTECTAIQQQCQAGPSSTSEIFVDDLISTETLASGLYVWVMGEVIQRARTSVEGSDMSLFLELLSQISDNVLGAATHACSEPLQNAFVDPRPTLWEAWLHTICKVSTIGTVENTSALLVNTCSSCVYLLLNKSSGKTQAERMNDPGMSLDGPHSLVMIEFLVVLFQSGHDVLRMVSQKIASLFPHEFTSLHANGSYTELEGVVVLVAALLRGFQGGLPPWSIEYAPNLFSALYCSLGKQALVFEYILQAAMHVWVPNSTPRLCGMAAGELYAGRSFQTMAETLKESFMQQWMEQVRKDDATAWRRFKALMKQACGGKKKDSDFGQRPALTKWDFERM
jgi:hypothetical protein